MDAVFFDTGLRVEGVAVRTTALFGCTIFHDRDLRRCHCDRGYLRHNDDGSGVDRAGSHCDSDDRREVACGNQYL